MESFTIIKRDNNSILIGLNSISDKYSALTQIERILFSEKFNGYIILDYLIFCTKLDSLDRFKGFKVLNGKINYSEKYIFTDMVYNYRKLANKHFAQINDNIIEYSMLNNSEKSKIKNT